MLWLLVYCESRQWIVWMAVEVVSVDGSGSTTCADSGQAEGEQGDQLLSKDKTA